ncbi:MAG: metallophosphoesterase [Bacilli bacterium]
MKIFNEKWEVTSNLIKKDYIFCLLSDIHNTKYSTVRVWRKIIETIKNQQPDNIFIPGDIVYTADDLLSKKTREKLEYLLYGLTSIAPTYISLGNHDFKDGKTLKAKDTLNYLKSLENDNLHLLNNEVETINNDIIVMGFSPRFDAYYPKHREYWNRYFIEDLIEAKLKYDKNKYIILLTHSPVTIKELSDTIENMLSEETDKKELAKIEEAKKALENINLVLCGHMHNGLIPKHWQKIGLIKSDKGIAAYEGQTLRNTFRKARYCRGMYSVFNGQMIVTGGVNKWSTPSPIIGLISNIVAKDITTVCLKKK